MNNLKRVLSLALSGIMLVGMMAVGASAAGFTDADKISNTDAVNTLVSLGVINGKDDGSYAPEEIVTRSQMAKMICVALNGGKDFKYGTKATPTYTDIKGHWAESYIEYCTSLNIIAGQGDGTFNPDAPVTASAASKMMLVAIGYDAEDEGMVGTDWEVNTNRLADNKGFYKSLSGLNVSEGLSRDDAAQVIYNACGAEMVEYDYKLVTNNGNLSTKPVAKDNGKTILGEKFDLANKFGYLTKTSFDDKKNEYTYTFTTAAGTYGPAIATADALTVSSVKSDKDFSELYGQRVNVLYKVEGSKTTVYGMYSDADVLATGAWGDATDKTDTIKFDGTTYDKNTWCSTVDFNTGAASAMKDAYTFAAIDNNDDGDVDVIVARPVTAAKVTYVGKDSITAGGVAYKFDECDIYEGVKKNDIVVITAKVNTAKGEAVVAKTETLEGTVGAINGDGDIRVDGTFYSFVTLGASPITGTENPSAGDEVKLQLVNGYIVYAEISEGATASVNDVLYVVAVEEGKTAGEEIKKDLAGDFKGVDGRVLLADGTKKTVKVMRVDTFETDGGPKSDSNAQKNCVPDKGMYTYKVNKDGVYELKAVKAAHEASADGSNKTGSLFVSRSANLPKDTTYTATATKFYVKNDKKLDDKFIADDAVIYLVTTNDGGSQKIISGKDLKSLGADFGTAASYLTKDVNGLKNVVVAVISGTAAIPVADDGTGYGYVTTAGVAEKNGDEWVVKFTVWTEEGKQELTATDADNDDVGNGEFKKGAFVKYTKGTKAGEVTGVAEVGTQTAITGYDNDKAIALDGINSGNAVSLKDDNKTPIIYVNTADKAGLEGGEIALAQKLDDGSYVKNAVAVMNGTTVEALFVDTANELKGAEYKITWATAASTGDAKSKVASFSVTDNADSAITTNSTAVKSGATVKVKLVATGSAAVEADAGETVTVTITLADNTTIVKEVEVAKGETFADTTVTFEMPSQNVKSIAVAVA